MASQGSDFTRTPGGIASIQRGFIAIAETETFHDATISAVNMNKSFIAYGGFRMFGGGAEARQYFTTIEFVNSTTIRAFRSVAGGGGSGITVTLLYEVVEYT
jgi:hypothetical protein